MRCASRAKPSRPLLADSKHKMARRRPRTTSECAYSCRPPTRLADYAASPDVSCRLVRLPRAPPETEKSPAKRGIAGATAIAAAVHAVGDRGSKAIPIRVHDAFPVAIGYAHPAHDALRAEGHGVSPSCGRSERA